MKKVLGFLMGLALVLCSCDGPTTQSYRGVVVYPSDVYMVGAEQWVERLKEGGLNLIALHADTVFEPLDSLKAFVQSDCGKTLLDLCEKNGIGVEYEIHALKAILPRELFETHPEYFRMSADGTRCPDYNMCFSCQEAYDAIREYLTEVCTWLKPTTHRYLFWTDDVADAFCSCPECSQYSCSEQALLYENKLQEILLEIDPLASVAHLCYSNTFEAPVKVKPAKGVFLEYAPMNRDRSQPISDETKAQFESNLAVFGAETAHILEYWLDESLTCGYQRHHPVKLNWIKEYCQGDIEYYGGLGVKSITTFATWLDSDYSAAFGEQSVLEVFREYGSIE